MPITVPYVKQTWIDNNGANPVSAARMGVLEEGILDVSQAPAVHVTHNAAQSTTTAVNFILAMNTERYDQAGGAAAAMHNTVTNNSRLTAIYAGIYSIRGQIEWATNVTGERLLEIVLNATTVIGRTRGTAGAISSPINQMVVVDYALAVNDFVELRCLQTSGGALNVNSSANYSPEFSMVRVG